VLPNGDVLRFLGAAALWLALDFVRRVLGRQGGRARTFAFELRSAHLLAGFNIAACLTMLLLEGPESASLHHAASTARIVCGALAGLRILEAVLFAGLRLRGASVPRILRSLVVWAISAGIAAAVLRHEYRLDLSSLIATSALLSVVLGFALQETLGNLFSGLTLHAEQPFEQGEFVTFGKWSGKILDVGWRSTRILTGDDDELLVPNSLISREVVRNHSRPSLHDSVEIPLVLDMDVPPARCKAVLREAVASCSLVLKEPPPRVLLSGFDNNGALYKVRFYGESYPKQRAALDQVYEAIWYALRRAAVEVPYPQQTIGYRERASEAEDRRRREHSAEAEDLLSRIDFIGALRPEDRKLLAERARYLEYGPGQSVVRQGESGDTFYLVARGELSVRIEGDKEVALLSRGAFFGEMSLLTGEPRSAAVVAVSEAGLLEIDRDAFSRVFERNPDVGKELATVIARRRMGLASARAVDAVQSIEAVESTLFDRICAMFAFRPRAA
jgi:small-conductance mechanosensitive channel/CRP-like cAMP-binding protein